MNSTSCNGIKGWPSRWRHKRKGLRPTFLEVNPMLFDWHPVLTNDLAKSQWNKSVGHWRPIRNCVNYKTRREWKTFSPACGSRMGMGFFYSMALSDCPYLGKAWKSQGLVWNLEVHFHSKTDALTIVQVKCDVFTYVTNLNACNGKVFYTHYIDLPFPQVLCFKYSQKGQK